MTAAAAFAHAAIVVAVSFSVLVGALAVTNALGTPAVYTQMTLDILESAADIGALYVLALILAALRRSSDGG